MGRQASGLALMPTVLLSYAPHPAKEQNDFERDHLKLPHVDLMAGSEKTKITSKCLHLYNDNIQN
jgi:hypothetical protein